MAEAFVNQFAPDRFPASSAGMTPTHINPLVVEAMAEIGLDLSGKGVTSVFDLFRKGELYDAVITVCDEAEEEGCPVFPGVTHRLRLQFPDPAQATGSHEEKLAQVSEIRDAIRDKLAGIRGLDGRRCRSGRLGGTLGNRILTGPRHAWARTSPHALRRGGSPFADRVPIRPRW